MKIISLDLLLESISIIKNSSIYEDANDTTLLRLINSFIDNNPQLKLREFLNMSITCEILDPKPEVILLSYQRIYEETFYTFNLWGNVISQNIMFFEYIKNYSNKYVDYTVSIPRSISKLLSIFLLKPHLFRLFSYVQRKRGSDIFVVNIRPLPF